MNLPPIPPLNLNTPELIALSKKIRSCEEVCKTAFSGNDNWREKASLEKSKESLKKELAKRIQKVKDDYAKLILDREKEQKELDENIQNTDQKFSRSITEISDLIAENNAISEVLESEINPISNLEL